MHQYVQKLLKYSYVCIKKFEPNNIKINISFFETTQHNIQFEVGWTVEL